MHRYTLSLFRQSAEDALKKHNVVAQSLLGMMNVEACLSTPTGPYMSLSP